MDVQREGPQVSDVPTNVGKSKSECDKNTFPRRQRSSPVSRMIDEAGLTCSCHSVISSRLVTSGPETRGLVVALRQ
jgi:hypothetical protein